MLFEDLPLPESNPPARPLLPAGFKIDYQIGFLFNFAAGKSTRFDLEPILIYKLQYGIDIKRISILSERGQAYLQPLSDSFFKKVMEFSDSRMIQWMNSKGIRYTRSQTGGWAHSSARDLVRIRHHYIDLLTDLWLELREIPYLYILKNGRFSPATAEKIVLGEMPADLSFKAEQILDLIKLSLTIKLDGNIANPQLLGNFVLLHNRSLFLPPSAESISILDQFRNGPQSFPISLKLDLVKRYLVPWQEKYPVDISERLKISLVEIDPVPSVHLTELNESNLMLRPQFAYEGVTIDYDNDKSLIQEHHSEIRIINRNKHIEDTLYEFLRSQHPAFQRQRNNSYYYLPFADVMKSGWFLKMMTRVNEAGYGITGLAELQKFRYTTTPPLFHVTCTNGHYAYIFDMAISWGEHKIGLREIRRILLNNQHTLMLPDGTLGHIPTEWINVYGMLLKTGSEENGLLHVHKFHFSLVEEVLDELDSAEVREDIRQRKEKLFAYDASATVPIPAGIVATLRPYQVSGFNWLRTLDEIGWGGCLADDMGLGKTLQTITFLHYLKDQYPGSTQLVICPTSLIFNWENELRKFAPGLKFHTYYGNQRQLDDEHFETYDIVLTSYGVMRNDLDTLTTFLWQYIILDESQLIKNPDARITRAVMKLKAVNRIILSGTPVQNNTADLFAQFSFLNPGILGTRDFFNREFSIPIDRDGNKERTAQLRKYIYPFTLRRTKEQVATDLPDKTVTVLWCSMDAEQRKLYNHFRENYRHLILKRIDEDGLSKSGMYVMEALLRLRQICDHPALLKDESHNEVPSVKIEELIREIRENVGDHKILIFSQFTEMLKLIRAEFENDGIDYCYLDGSVTADQRRTEVTRFTETPEVKAFLISLKAGGVGLNLTVADYVYLVDPWWNPAAEMQAIDRAHRIGQTRKVFAYKMICKDTVEEKILQLQDRKKQLADDLIQEDSGFVKTLTRDDIDFLLG